MNLHRRVKSIWGIAVACVLWCITTGIWAKNISIVDNTLREGIDSVIHRPSLAYDVNGNPRVAYQHPSKKDLNYAWSDDGGKNWVISTVDNACAFDLGVSLSLTHLENPHIAYTISGEGYSGRLMYAVSDDSGKTWQVDKLSRIAHYPISLTLDEEDIPSIVFIESIHGGPLVFLQSDSNRWNWRRNIIDDGRYDDVVGRGLSCASGVDGSLHICYFVQSGRWHEELRYAYSEDRDWYWDESDVDASPEPVSYTSIAVDSYGDKHIVYSTEQLPEDPKEAVREENIYYAYAPENSDMWETDLLGKVIGKGLPEVQLINNTPFITYQSSCRDVDGYIRIVRLFDGEWVMENTIGKSPFGVVDFDPCWLSTAAISEKHKLGFVFVDRYGSQEKLYQPVLGYFSCDIPPEIEVFLDIEEFENEKDTYYFGTVLVGTSSDPVSLTVRNSGKSGLFIEDIAIKGSDFHIRDITGNILASGNETRIDGNDCQEEKEVIVDLQPPDEYTWDIVFTPTQPGLRKAFVIIRNNDPDEAPFTFVVEGTGFLPRTPF